MPEFSAYRFESFSAETRNLDWVCPPCRQPSSGVRRPEEWSAVLPAAKRRASEPTTGEAAGRGGLAAGGEGRRSAARLQSTFSPPSSKKDTASLLG